MLFKSIRAFCYNYFIPYHIDAQKSMFLRIYNVSSKMNLKVIYFKIRNRKKFTCFFEQAAFMVRTIERTAFGIGTVCCDCFSVDYHFESAVYDRFCAYACLFFQGVTPPKTGCGRQTSTSRCSFSCPITPECAAEPEAAAPWSERYETHQESPRRCSSQSSC